MSGKYNESNQSISCSVCKQCGGCQYVDIPYEKELKKKSAYLKQLFEGICTVGEVHGMYRPAFYRNKVHAVVGLDKQKGIVTGTYAEGTHRLVPVDVCMIEDQKADSIIATLRELFASFKYIPYNEDTHRGFMRHILIRRGFSTKEMMVVLVTADNKFPSKNNFLKALLEKHPDITTVVQNINDYSTSMVLGKANKVLYGKGSSKLSTAANGTALVDGADLANHFNTDGSMNKPLYAQKDDGTWAEVGAEQISKFVDVTPGKDAVQAEEKEVTKVVTKALELNLHVGADSNDTNKINLKIDSMSSKNIGVDGLKVDTEENATNAIDTISAAIQKVSDQRSALGAVQNRLEHTIANLDNVVENTTSAESRIRDVDMAEEMVEYSKNNILAQAGQSMLAQANQSTQGVLSLLQ